MKIIKQKIRAMIDKKTLNKPIKIRMNREIETKCEDLGWNLNRSSEREGTWEESETVESDWTEGCGRRCGEEFAGESKMMWDLKQTKHFKLNM